MNHQDGKSNKGLIKSAGVVGGSTLLSRVLGMARDIVNARQFGISWQWDAFLIAFMVPNFFRRLVGEGALSSAFIPVYSEILSREGKESAFKFASAMLSLIGILVFGLVIVTELSITAALQWDGLSERVILTLELLRQLFPYLFLISIFALGMGILNSHRFFFIPALGPVILNVFWIAGTLWIAPKAGQLYEHQLKWLAWVLICAGVAQVASQQSVLKSIGFKWKFQPNFNHPGVRKALALILPALLGFAVMQINMMVDMLLAYFVGPGANSSLWYGARLMQFPLGIFGIGMGTALLPMISEHAAKKDMEASEKTILFALKIVFLIVIPASVGLMLLAGPIVEVLFERGAFDAHSTQRTAFVLYCYGFGLFAYSGQKIITTGFHAFQDTQTPVKIAAVALAANIILNLLLMGPLKEGGLALATSISGVIQFVLLIIYYRKGYVKIPVKPVLISFLKIVLSALVMGAVITFTYGILHGRFSGSFLGLSLILVATIFAGMLFYYVFCFILRLEEVKELTGWIQNKIRYRGKRFESS